MKVPHVFLANLATHLSGALQRIRRHIVPPPVLMLEFVTASWLSQALTVAASLGIADALKAEPKSAEQIARETGAHPEGIRRLLCALSQHGIFTQTKRGQFRNTHLSKVLCTDAQDSVRSFAMFVGHIRHREHWSDLEAAIRTQRPSPPSLRGKTFFDYTNEDRAFAGLFHDAMSETSNLMSAPLLAAYRFEDGKRIVDVGGGHGELLASILRSAPTATGVLFDLPEVTPFAISVLEAHGVGQRCRVESGSFFEAVPEAGDIYLLKQILHDWDDDDAAQILSRVRRAMAVGKTLLLMEMLLPAGNAPHLGKLTDLEMLVSVGGRERTREQLRALLERTHFRLRRVVRTAAPVSLVEAIAVPALGSL